MQVLFFFLTLIILFPIAGYPNELLTVTRATKEISLSGYTRSDTTATVSSEVSGRVLRVNYDIGDRTDKRPILEIDPTFINFQIQQVRLDIQMVDVNRKSSNSRVAFLRKELHRIEKLFEENRTSEVKRDAAAEDLSQAVLTLEGLDAKKRLLETRLSELQEKLARHQIRVPQGWVVVEKLVEPGEVINPGLPLMRLADYSRLVVQLSVSNEELKALRSMSNPFDIEAGGEPAKASVHWVNPEFNETTRKLLIELVVTDFLGEKRGGIFCKLPILIESEGLQIPKAAVTNRYDNPRVTIQSSGETINVMILSEVNSHFVIAKDQRLAIGTVLAPAN